MSSKATIVIISLEKSGHVWYVKEHNIMLCQSVEHVTRTTATFPVIESYPSDQYSCPTTLLPQQLQPID